MMMYQLLCGHVNYALGKTRMPVKKNKKDTLFWIHVYINILKIIKSYLQYIASLVYSKSSHCPPPPHHHHHNQYCYKTHIAKTYGVINDLYSTMQIIDVIIACDI
jgi:hypothetical protein